MKTNTFEEKLNSALIKAFDRGYEVSRLTQGLADEKFIAHQETTVNEAKRAIIDLVRQETVKALEKVKSNKRIYLVHPSGYPEKAVPLFAINKVLEEYSE